MIYGTTTKQIVEYEKFKLKNSKIRHIHKEKKTSIQNDHIHRHMSAYIVYVGMYSFIYLQRRNILVMESTPASTSALAVVEKDVCFFFLCIFLVCWLGLAWLTWPSTALRPIGALGTTFFSAVCRLCLFLLLLFLFRLPSLLLLLVHLVFIFFLSVCLSAS